MKQYRVRVESSELRFYHADGWTEDLVQSILDQGALKDTGVYIALAHTPSPASFNIDRLTDLMFELVDNNGKPVLPKERAIYIKFFSQHGVFNHGDKWRDR